MSQRISSKAYRDGARGQRCTFRIAGVCTGGGEDTVFAHIRDRHTGRSIKASDTSGGDCCFACHEVFDGRAKLPGAHLLDGFDWLFYALRAIQETIENRIERGILTLRLDAPTVAKTAKVRSAKPSRPIKSPGFPKGGPKQRIPSRPMRQK